MGETKSHELKIAEKPHRIARILDVMTLPITDDQKHARKATKIRHTERRRNIADITALCHMASIIFICIKDFKRPTLKSKV
jgi:hypothetical protein